MESLQGEFTKYKLLQVCQKVEKHNKINNLIHLFNLSSKTQFNYLFYQCLATTFCVNCNEKLKLRILSKENE